MNKLLPRSWTYKPLKEEELHEKKDEVIEIEVHDFDFPPAGSFYYLLSLPDEILIMILEYLGPLELIQLGMTAKRLKELTDTNDLWIKFVKPHRGKMLFRYGKSHHYLKTLDMILQQNDVDQPTSSLKLTKSNNTLQDCIDTESLAKSASVNNSTDNLIASTPQNNPSVLDKNSVDWKYVFVQLGCYRQLEPIRLRESARQKVEQKRERVRTRVRKSLYCFACGILLVILVIGIVFGL